MDKLDIMRAIKERGLLAKDIAQKMNISHIALSNRINGNPRLDTLHNIAKAVGCNIRDFFYTEEDDSLKTDLFANTQETPKEDTSRITDSGTEKNDTAPVIHTAFCPHCGAKVRVGVVLLPE